jgi:uncharacterized protein YjeT (DUF2065 family)
VNEFDRFIPLAPVIMGIILLLVRRNPWPAGVRGSDLSLRTLRLMGAFMILVGLALFALINFSAI